MASSPLEVSATRFLYVTQEGSFRVSMRSNVGGVNVAEICASFGGGGHICAAGCSVDAPDIDAAIAEIVKKVSEVI